MLVCLRDDGSDDTGGQRLKIYHDTFASILPEALNQLAETVRFFLLRNGV